MRAACLGLWSPLWEKTRLRSYLQQYCSIRRAQTIHWAPVIPSGTFWQVINSVPMDKSSEDMFAYFEPLYEMIHDMPRPPEYFFKKKTGMPTCRHSLGGRVAEQVKVWAMSLAVVVVHLVFFPTWRSAASNLNQWFSNPVCKTQLGLLPCQSLACCGLLPCKWPLLSLSGSFLGAGAC